MKILIFFAKQIATDGINKGVDELWNYSTKAAPAGTPEANFREALGYLRGSEGHSIDRAEAEKYARRSAAQGYSPAQKFLGDLYLRDKNYDEARKWFLAASKYEADAEFQLGNLAYLGRLGYPNYTEALSWYRQAAQRRHSAAEYQVASILMLGQAHPPSEAEKVEAANDVEDAAGQGLAIAQTDIGYQYASGIGRARDYCKAMEWSEKAAEKGQAIAANNLGTAYENGQCSGSVNRIFALRYFRRATDLGDAQSVTDSNRVRNYIKGELSSLATTPDNSWTETCVLRKGAPFYDLNANEVRSPFMSDKVTIAARQNNNEFARTAPTLLFFREPTLTFVHATDLSGCQASPK